VLKIHNAFSSFQVNSKSCTECRKYFCVIFICFQQSDGKCLWWWYECYTCHCICTVETTW